MKMRLSFKETGTGEDYLFDTEGEFSAEGAIKAILTHYCGEDEPSPVSFHVKAWVVAENGRSAAFVLTSVEPYFGFVFTIGVVYLDFLGGDHA